MLGGTSLKRRLERRKNSIGKAEETSPRGGLYSLGNQPNLGHNLWVGWAVGLSPLPAWVCPVLKSSLVAWIHLVTAHQVLVAQVTDWKLERGWNSGWHRWYLLGKEWEMFKFPKSIGSAVISIPSSNSYRIHWDFTPWGESDPSMGMLWFPHPGSCGFAMAVAAPNPIPILFLTSLGCALRAGGFPGKRRISFGKTQQGEFTSHQLGNELSKWFGNLESQNYFIQR